MFDLRAYQIEAVDATFSGWQQFTRVAVELATGGGKTAIAAETVRRTLQANPKAKIVFLAHRGELLRSGARAIAKHNSIQVGVVDGQVQVSARENNLKKQVVCINTATLGVSKNARANGSSRATAVAGLHSVLGNVDLVILDECHRANTDTALDCLRELGCFSTTRLLGITATLFRTDGKLLTDVFESCVYRKNLLQLIDDGWLVDVEMKKALVHGLDLTKVSVTRSMGLTDFNATDLDKVMEESGAEGVVAEFAKRYTTGRKTLVFTPTVAAAERVAQAFSEVGLDAVVVHGSMPATARAEALERFENGDLQYIINCMLLTEGVDLPSCSCIIMARPTKSQQLYLQILGRSLRLAEGKDKALVIDLVGATAINGLVVAESIFDHLPGETALEAKQRRDKVEQEISAKVQKVLESLTNTEREEITHEYITSGSFNLFDVEVPELVEAVKKAAKEKREQKERAKQKSLPPFPGPGRCGSMMEMGFDFLIALDCYGTAPKYKGSYAAVVTLADGRLAPFYCNKSKKFDDGRYDFLGEPVDSFEDAEKVILDLIDRFPGTAREPYFKTNKLDPAHPNRKKPATSKQVEFMFNMLGRKKLMVEQVADYKNHEYKKQISLGVALDWIDYCLLVSDALKQADSVRSYYNGLG